MLKSILSRTSPLEIALWWFCVELIALFSRMNIFAPQTLLFALQLYLPQHEILPLFSRAGQKVKELSKFGYKRKLIFLSSVRAIDIKIEYKTENSVTKQPFALILVSLINLKTQLTQ